MEIRLSNKILDGLDIADLLKKASVETERKQILGKSGTHHYRLLKYLSHQFDNCFFCDLGTHKGSSALALGENPSNKVVSFDLEERIIPIIETIKYVPENPVIVRPKNVDFVVTSRILDYPEVLLKSKLIFVDISHNGRDEKEIYSFLLNNGWKGIMILDDIKYYLQFENPDGSKNDSLKELYDWFNELSTQNNVYDLTNYGHHTGTGLIDFGGQLKLTLE